MVAVMNIYANSPYGMYWLKSSGIKGPKDFAGKKIGNPPWDAARQMWPALAKKVGVDGKSVKWVNIQPNAKLAALKAKSIDVTTSFYNIHHIFKRELGARTWASSRGRSTASTPTATRSSSTWTT